MPRTPITSLNCWRPRRLGAGLSMEARHVALLAHPHAAPPALLADEWIIAVRREDGTGLAREIAAAVKVAPQVVEIVGVPAPAALLPVTMRRAEGSGSTAGTGG